MNDIGKKPKELEERYIFVHECTYTHRQIQINPSKQKTGNVSYMKRPLRFNTK